MYSKSFQVVNIKMIHCTLTMIIVLSRIVMVHYGIGIVPVPLRRERKVKYISFTGLHV